MALPPDSEKNRFSARAKRYARVGTKVGGVAARMAGQRLIGSQGHRAGNAAALASALGGLKGPIMKVAQLLATIPDAVPPEYASELMKLQSQAPPMGWAFVKRRMGAELGADWQKKFSEFEHHPAAAASLGQVHRAHALDGSALACKLQYPEMQSAVEADLINQITEADVVDVIDNRATEARHRGRPWVLPRCSIQFAYNCLGRIGVRSCQDEASEATMDRAARRAMTRVRWRTSDRGDDPGSTI